jgi:cobalt-zinc-cadmium efflux system membrane fusion protein
VNSDYRKRLQIAMLGVGALIVGAAVVATHTRAAPPAAEATTTSPAADSAPRLPDSVNLSAEALANVGLRYANAELRPGVQTIAATGVVAFDARHFAKLSSPSRGRIIAVDVAAGDHVHAGQRLAMLDQFDLGDVRSQVTNASAAVADAKAALDAANAALARGTELVPTGGIAQSELERRRTASADAQAMLASRQAELRKWLGMQQRLMPLDTGAKSGQHTGALARLGPGDSLGALIAPFDGVIGNVGAAAGDIVDSAAPILTLADLSTMWIEANVSERDAAAVKPGQNVTAHIDAYPDRQFIGRVIDVAAQADASTGTVGVRCELPNPDDALRANMFATVTIDVPLGHDAVLVPDAALQDVNGQTAVFIPAGNGHFTWRVVHTGGYAAGGMTQIVSGLAGGTRVVAQGSYWLKAALMKGMIPDEG